MLAAMMLLYAPGVLAQAGATSVSVTLPEILMFEYVPSLHASVDANGSLVAVSAATPVDGGDEGLVDVAVQVDGQLIERIASEEVDARVTGTLAGVFAVRGLSLSGRTSLGVELERSQASHPAGSVVVATAVEAVGAGQRGGVVRFDSPGLSQPTVLGLGLTLDLSGARNGGWHSGISVRVTVENF